MLSLYHSRLFLGTSATLLSLTVLVGQIQKAEAVNIILDYSYDTTANSGDGFFNTQSKKDILEEATLYFENSFNDTLNAITPSASNTWSPNFTHPGTGVAQYTDASLENLSIPANDILVFAGGHDISGSSIGQGGPGGFSASGNQAWFDEIISRGETGALGADPTDFAPWGGSITFDTATTWHFGNATSTIPSGENDFLSVAIHELAHLLGIGTADSWDTPISPANEFAGTKSREINNNTDVPLEPDLGHWLNGTKSTAMGVVGTTETALDPILTTGTRELLTDLDYAGLEDTGWEVDPSVYSSNVPFEFSPSLGILVVAGMFGTKKVLETRKIK